MTTTNSSAWDLSESHDDEIRNKENRIEQQIFNKKPDQIRELLAEATGEEPITNKTTIYKVPVITKSVENITNNNQNVEERLRILFHLSAKETLKGG